MSMTIRKASEEDISVLEDLFSRFSNWNLHRRESLKEAINDANGELLVVQIDDQIAGFLHQVFFADPLHAGLNSDITNLFVKEEYRRRGVGSSLVQKALENAKRRNVIEIHVTTREDNKVAMKFYQKLGFTREGVLFEKNP